jgi:protein-S-isoprenylcysteine O-methyltransferase Ste14
VLYFIVSLEDCLYLVSSSIKNAYPARLCGVNKMVDIGLLNAFAPVILFPSSDAATLFGVVFLIWMLSEIIGGVIIPSLRRKGERIRRRRSASSILPILAACFTWFVSKLFAAYGIAMLPSYVTYVGSALVLAGTAVRQWAIAVLGRYFSDMIGVQKDQKVVQNGPYRLIRHPSYAGLLLIFIGWGLAFQSWGALLAVILVFGVCFGYRMISEERMLTSELGKSYTEYMKRTKRIIPFLI